MGMIKSRVMGMSVRSIVFTVILASGLLAGTGGCNNAEGNILVSSRTAELEVSKGELQGSQAVITNVETTTQAPQRLIASGATEKVPTTEPAPPSAAAPTNTAVPTKTAVPSGEGVQATAPDRERTKYHLEAALDYEGHTLEVKEAVEYRNTTGERISYVEMVVEAKRYPGTFRLKTITDSQGGRIFQYQLKETTLTIRLPEEMAPGDTDKFSLEYTLKLLEVSKLPQLRPYPLGYTSLQTNFGDWYPFIPPYKRGVGWLVHPPAYYGEHLVYDLADFEAAIRVIGADPGLVFAASSPQELDGEWRRFKLEGGRSFAWSVSPHYEVMTETLKLATGESTVISSYYFPFHAEAGGDLLKTMMEAMEVYSRVFGAFPQMRLTAVQADFMDGMEYDGLFFLSTDFYNWHQGGEADFLAALSAHETAHQWWYGIVGNDQALEPWLDEALCTYSERIYYENLYPGSLDWWWAYRVNYYEPEGWVDMTIYDAPQAVGQYREYRDPVYLRGALFLEELRGIMGDEAFYAGLRAYIKRSAYGFGEGSGFWEAMEEQTSEDLSEIKATYFSKTD